METYGVSGQPKPRYVYVSAVSGVALIAEVWGNPRGDDRAGGHRDCQCLATRIPRGHRPTAPRAHPGSATDTAAPGPRSSGTEPNSSRTRTLSRATARAPAAPATRPSSAAVLAGGFGVRGRRQVCRNPAGKAFGDEGSGVAGARIVLSDTAGTLPRPARRRRVRSSRSG
jgi:hypothetical protein